MESVSLAFLLLLERLSPAERAAYVLREVFDYSHGEIARVLARSEASCRQLVLRARTHLRENRPRFAASARTAVARPPRHASPSSVAKG